MSGGNQSIIWLTVQFMSRYPNLVVLWYQSELMTWVNMANVACSSENIRFSPVQLHVLCAPVLWTNFPCHWSMINSHWLLTDRISKIFWLRISSAVRHKFLLHLSLSTCINIVWTCQSSCWPSVPVSLHPVLVHLLSCSDALQGFPYFLSIII